MNCSGTYEGLAGSGGGIQSAGNSVVAALCWSMDVTQWVVSSVVTLPESKDRLDRVHVWIEIYTHLFGKCSTSLSNARHRMLTLRGAFAAMKSYNLCFAVALGLLHPLVYNTITNRFALLPSEDRKELQKILEFVDPGPAPLNPRHPTPQVLTRRLFPVKDLC